MKVTHVIDSGGYYGAEVMLVHLCQAQQKTGMDVEVISIGTLGNYKKPLEEKLEEHGIRYISWRMRALPDLRESFRILKHCKQGGSDVIHSHGYKGNILLGLIPRRLRKIPVITTVHGYTRQYELSKMAIYQYIDKFFLRLLDAVVIVSEGMKHQIPKLQIEKKLYVIENGIPLIDSNKDSDFSPAYEENNFIIASVGRLSKEKNFSFLIESTPKILTLIPNAKIFIYGEGSERSKLEALIKRLGLTNTVSLPGYINHPYRAYEKADVYINCSITEGMPISILEAMRASCPMVVSDIPANKAVLKNLSPEHWITFEFTEASLADAVYNIFQSNEKSLWNREAIKSHFLKFYTSDVMASKYYSLYMLFEKKRNE